MIVRKDRRTKSPPVDLFGREREHREQFNHYLDHHLNHSESKRNIGINRESSEEIFDAFKDIDDGFVTFPHVFGLL